MNLIQRQIVRVLGVSISVSALTVSAGDRPPVVPRGSGPLIPMSSVRPSQSQPKVATNSSRPPIRQAQLDSHGRYPFGQNFGGYRYPFSYPYYRNRPRHYPFGVGPYGPYGSNYGGYSGNAYDPDVYGSPVPGLAPAAPPDAAPAPLPGSPPAVRAPVPSPVVQPGASDVARGEKMLDSGMQAQLTPSVQGPAYGEPEQFPGGSPFNPGYGHAQTFRAFPFGHYGDQQWFGPHSLIYGFGHYPNPNYSYFAGPPAGFNVSGPEFAPQYFNYGVRNFGPYNPGLGGMNVGAGFSQGW